MTNLVAKGLSERFGRYHLLGALGEGSLGPLLVAEQAGPDGSVQIVALRQFHGQLTESASSKLHLAQAARAASRLRHPNISPSDELEEADGVEFLATAYHPGENLASVLASSSRTPMPPAIAASVAYQIVEALRYAHDATDVEGNRLGVVHQDIRPSNVFMTYDGTVRVLGFGAPGVLSHIPGVRGSSRGGFSYTAPEALEGAPPDSRGDIFSLGAVLWECLTGRQLFGAETVAKSKDAVRSRYVEPPSIVRPEVATGFDEVVLRALSRDPRRRFQDLAEVSRALKRLLMSLPHAPAPEDVAEWLRHVFAPERIALKMQIAQGNAVEGALARLRLLGDPAAGEMGPRGGQPPSGTPPVVPGGATLPPPGAGASRAVPTPLTTKAVTKASAASEAPTTSGGGGAKADLPGRVPGTSASARPPIAIIGVGAAILGVIVAVWLFRPTSPERTGESSVAALGSLQIDSTPPGAQVLIDGDPSGRATPARITGLRAGRKVDIQVDMPGYRSTKQTVQVPVGGPTALRFVLEESTGTVRLEGVPHGAKTYVDDAPVNAAEPLSLSIGTHRLRVEVSGELFSSMKLDVKRGKQVLHVQAAEGTGK